MADDLFKDCDCGDCPDCDCDCDFGDCDCDCCDCDCSCDDCLPDNNLMIICCCIPPPSRSDTNNTNRASTSPDCFPCCCCCNQRSYSPRRQRRERRKRRKKKGFCCWRLWCCFARNEPSPPPSPPRPGPDELPPRGKYPVPEDMEIYMHDRWARDHELDMPPRGYKYGGRYPVHEEMRMYRDEYYGRGGRWNDIDSSSKGYYRHSGWDERRARGMASRDYYERDRRAKKDRGKAAKDEGEHRQGKPDELDVGPRDYGKDIDKYSSHGERSSSFEELDMPHQDHRFQGKWSRPIKYGEIGNQTKN